jgi:putative transposase
LAHYANEAHGLSIRQACRVVKISRAAFYYRAKLSDDEKIAAKLRLLAEAKPRWGFGKMFPWLRRKGYSWNHKRVHRIYCDLKLNIRTKPKKRLPSRNPKPLAQPDSANRCWSLDFMHDSLITGRPFRIFHILDDFNRELLGTEIDTSLPAERVIRTLEQIADWRGYPEYVRVDNGPEFISGKPAQNAYIERFNRTYREDVLDLYLFRTLTEVRELSSEWSNEYNGERPHESLNNMTPYEYLKTFT